jgi:hypothetical protein
MKYELWLDKQPFAIKEETLEDMQSLLKYVSELWRGNPSGKLMWMWNCVKALLQFFVAKIFWLKNWRGNLQKCNFGYIKSKNTYFTRNKSF